jgi:hypothetical protein
MPSIFRNHSRHRRHGTPDTPEEATIERVGVGTAVARNTASDDFADVTRPVEAMVTGDLQIIIAYTRVSGITHFIATDTGWDEQLDDSGSGGSWFIATKSYTTGDSIPQMNWTGVVAGNTHFAQMFVYRGVDVVDPIDVLGTLSHNASQQDIGPITGITPTAAGTFIIVAGGKADDWTSVADLTGDSLTWAELGETASTLGSDGGLVVDEGTGWTSGAISNKTFTVTGGAANVGSGIMFSLNPGGEAVTLHDLDIVMAGTGSGNASGDGIDTDVNATYQYAEGQDVQITANPDAGSSFGGFTGDGSNVDADTRLVDMDTDKSVTLTFTTIAGGGESEVDGTGAVLAEDLVTIENPTVASLWQSKMSPFGTGAWTSADKSIQRLSASPDPHTAVGQGAPSANYRRLKTIKTTLDGAVSGTPTTITVADTSDFPASARGGAQDEGLATINGQRAFTYSSKTSTSFQFCGGFSGTPTSFTSGTQVKFQSPFDASVPNTSTRTQLLKHSTNPGSVFYQFLNGEDYIMYFSVKFEHPTPLVGIHATTGRSQLWQYKEYPNAGGGLPSANPIMAINEREDDLHLINKGTPLATIDIDKSVGWMRFAIALRMSPSSATGKIQLFGDIDGSLDMFPLTSVIACETLENSTGMGIPSIGPYQNILVPAIIRDYANIQVCEYTGF